MSRRQIRFAHVARAPCFPAATVTTLWAGKLTSSSPRFRLDPATTRQAPYEPGEHRVPGGLAALSGRTADSVQTTGALRCAVLVVGHGCRRSGGRCGESEG